MRTLALSLALLLVCLPHAAQGEAPLQLGEILKRVWESSPLLEGQETQAGLAAGDRWRRFIVNEPQFQYSNSDDNTANSFGLSLTTAFPGKALAYTRLDGAKARGGRAEFLARKYDLTKTVTQAYLDCAAAQAVKELQKLTSADLETLFFSLRALYETGHSTQAEKIGGELQARQAKLDLLNAEDRQEVLCKKLEILISKASEGSSSFTVTQTVLPDDLDDALVAELGAATADQNRSVAAIDLAEANSYTAWWSQLPDLTFNFSRNHYLYLPGSPSGNEWANTYGVSVTLPLLFPFHETVEARRAKSQAAIDQNAAELQKVAADSDQFDGAKEYRRSRARLTELRAKDLALAEALVESTYSAYRAGKLGYAELVLSRRTLTDIRTQEIQLRSSIVNAHLRCLNRCGASDSSPREKTP